MCRRPALGRVLPRPQCLQLGQGAKGAPKGHTHRTARHTVQQASPSRRPRGSSKPAGRPVHTARLPARLCPASTLRLHTQSRKWVTAWTDGHTTRTMEQAVRQCTAQSPYYSRHAPPAPARASRRGPLPIASAHTSKDGYYGTSHIMDVNEGTVSVPTSVNRVSQPLPLRRWQLLLSMIIRHQYVSAIYTHTCIG